MGSLRRAGSPRITNVRAGPRTSTRCAVGSATRSRSRRRRDRLRLGPQRPVLSGGRQPGGRRRAGRPRLEARRQAPQGESDPRGAGGPRRAGAAVRGRQLRLRLLHLDDVHDPGHRRRPAGAAARPQARRDAALRRARAGPRRGVRRWQHRLEPMQKRLFGGCHLTRPIVDLLTPRGLHDHRARRLLRGGLAEVPRGALARRRGLPVGSSRRWPGLSRGHDRIRPRDPATHVVKCTQSSQGGSHE